MSKEIGYTIILANYPKLSKTLDVYSLYSKYKHNEKTFENHRNVFIELEFKLKGNKTTYDKILKSLDVGLKEINIAAKHHVSTSMSANLLIFLNIVKKIDNSSDYEWNNYNRTPEDIAMYYLAALKTLNQEQNLRRNALKKNLVLQEASLITDSSIQSEINFIESNDECIEKKTIENIDEKPNLNEVNRAKSNEIYEEVQEYLLNSLLNKTKNFELQNLVNVNIEKSFENVLNNLVLAISEQTKAIKEQTDEIKNLSKATYTNKNATNGLSEVFNDFIKYARTGK